MKPLSPSEKEKIISRIFWDAYIDTVNAESLIDKHLESIEEINSQQFFRKLLASCDWYTLRKLIPAEELKMVLDDTIINGLFPKDMQTKYKYARDLLSR